MLKIRTVTGLTDLYVLFYGSGIAVPAVEGTGNDATWYFVSDASLVSAELPAGFHSGVFLQGDYTAPDIADDDTNGGVFTGFNWDDATEIEDFGVSDISSPSADAIAAQVRVKLSDELSLIDTSISSRLAASAYVSPDNTTIEDIYEVVGSIGGAGGGILNARIAYSSLTPNQYLQLIQGEEKILTFIVEADGRFDNQSATAISVKLADPEGNVVAIENADVARITEELDVQVFRITLSAEDTATLSEGLLRIEIAFDTQKAVLTHTVKVVEAL